MEDEQYTTLTNSEYRKWKPLSQLDTDGRAWRHFPVSQTKCANISKMSWWTKGTSKIRNITYQTATWLDWKDENPCRLTISTHFVVFQQTPLSSETGVWF